MKRVLFTAAILAVLPNPAYSQNDLQRVLQGLQQLQNFSNQQQHHHNNNQGGQRPRAVPYNGNPNASGNQNQGNFNNDFFGPPQHNHGFGGSDPNSSGVHNSSGFNNSGFFPGGSVNNGNVIYPGNTNYPSNQNHFHNHGQVTYPNNTYPNSYPSNTYPNSYPSSSYHNHNHSSPYPSYPGTSHLGSTTYPSVTASTSAISQPPVAPTPSYSRLPITVRCGPDCVGTCSYELVTTSGSSFPYQIRAGQAQNLVETTNWTFRYSPAPGAPSQSYQLKGGRQYELRQTGGNWQLYLVP
ncbi:MAG: hypothetical protein R3C49_08530 [Planctomycetaceae bacterium]